MRTPADTAPEGHGIDPITASVILGALENIAVEMGYKLMRMSYSSIIRESEDFGTALVNARGRTVMRIKAEHAPPVRPYSRLCAGDVRRARPAGRVHPARRRHHA